MATSTLRSNNILNDAVRASRALAVAAAEVKACEQELKRLQPKVLEMIGESRTVVVDGVICTIKPRFKTSTRRAVSDERAVEVLEPLGVEIKDRSARYVHPSTFSSAVASGIVPDELYTIETEIVGIDVI